MGVIKFRAKVQKEGKNDVIFAPINMANTDSTFNKRRLRTSYITSVVSLAMVLFMLGMLGLLLVNAKKLSDTTKESFTVSIFFKDSVNDAQILAFQNELNAAPYTRSTVFTDKTTAAKQFQEQLGEDFVDFLGYNPLPASIDVNFKTDYTDQKKFNEIEQNWLRNPMVEKIDYPRNLINQIAENMRKLSWFFLAFSAVLLFIAVTLINNTIRLAIYSKRFLIKTMQLVGAKKSFIRAPFLTTSLLQGFLGSLVAIGLLTGVLAFAEHKIPDLKSIRDIQLLAMLAGAILFAGVFLSFICTFFAVRKYLNLNTDSLY
jgi:cell division transport system permease protein